MRELSLRIRTGWPSSRRCPRPSFRRSLEKPQEAPEEAVATPQAPDEAGVQPPETPDQAGGGWIEEVAHDRLILPDDAGGVELASPDEAGGRGGARAPGQVAPLAVLAERDIGLRVEPIVVG